METTLDEPDVLVLEPREQFDASILGIARRFNQTFAVYSEAGVLAAIAAEMDDEEEDPETAAREYFEFNTVGAWMGEGTPAFLSPWSEEEGELLRVRVAGHPVGQGSKQTWIDKATGKVRMREDGGTAHATWRLEVTAAVVEAMGLAGIEHPELGPVAARLTFYLLRNIGDYGSGKNSTVIASRAPNYPAKMPDVDKLTRAVFDSITDARLWADDCQVVDVRARKRYVDRYGSLPEGVEIVVGVMR